jgi:hypothetical protein
MNHYYKEAIDYHVGKGCTPDIDYILQNDGVETYIKVWNITSITQPTMQQLIDISNQLKNVMEMQQLKELAIAKQIEAQKAPTLLLNKFNLDYSDETVDLLIKARVMLKGTNTSQLQVIDYQGIPNVMTLTEINELLGDEISNIIGVISLRRKDLHTQMIEILKKAINGEPYDVKYI